MGAQAFGTSPALWAPRRFRFDGCARTNHCRRLIVSLSVPICGQPAACPPCSTCGCGGGLPCTGTGPNGSGVYCFQGGGLGSCPSGSCLSSGQVCCGGTCVAPCTT